jgi:CRISPR-associated endonuclease/helicase Cas3
VGLDCDSAYRELTKRRDDICGFDPREHQRIVWNKLSEDIPGFCLLSGTGSGKTEAVMIPSLVFDKRLIMVYPVRSLVEDQIERAKRYIRQLLMCKLSEGRTQERKTLIIDMGGTEEAYKYRLFDEKSIKVILDQIRFWSSIRNFRGITISENHSDEPREQFGSNVDLRAMSRKLEELIDNRKGFELIFSAGPKIMIDIVDVDAGQFLVLKSRKHYYGGDVILTTLDKFIYRFFGYGEKKWNLLYPYRFLINPKKLLIAFDEAHAYGEVAYTNFVRLISSLIASPQITVAIMSATLPNAFTDYLKTKFRFELVRGGDYKGEKTYKLHEIDDPKARNKKILELVKQNSVNRIIVIRNTVKNAFYIYSSLTKRKDDTTNTYNFNGVPVFFYHGRLFDFVKSERYKELKKLDRAESPYILITTHAIEVGCDLNSNIMITDFCNPHQLIQRSGRCAREKNSHGILHVIGDELLAEEKFLKEDLVDYQHFVEVLKENSGKTLPEERIRNEIIKHKLARDEITDALFRLMYSYVYNFDRTKENLHESGILVTRSWEPSVNVVLLKNNADLERIREIVSNREKNIEELLDFLLEQKWSYSTSPLRISLESLSKDEDGEERYRAKDFLQDTFVTGVDDSRTSEDEMGYVKGNLNPYLNEIYVFYKPHEPLNKNPYVFGLVSLPKIFDLKTVDVKKRVLIKKQLMSDDYKNWTGDVKVEYIDLSDVS